MCPCMVSLFEVWIHSWVLVANYVTEALFKSSEKGRVWGRMDEDKRSVCGEGDGEWEENFHSFSPSHPPLPNPHTFLPQPMIFTA